MKQEKKQGFYSQLPDEEKKKIGLDCFKKVIEEEEKIMREYKLIKKIKSLPRYTFLTDKREFTTADVISREAVIKILNQNNLLKEL